MNQKSWEHFFHSRLRVEMRFDTPLLLLARSTRSVILALTMAVVPTIYAQTIWTGPTTNFTQTVHNSTDSDVLVAGKVALSRNSAQWLFNTAAGETSAGDSSPLDTEWAFGSIENATSLSYTSFASYRDGNLGAVLGVAADGGSPASMVLHLINEDTYVSVTFTAWGEHGSGGFAYTRSTPAVVAPTPTVSITSPTNGAAFTAPASVTIDASASVSSGTVTNVAFFAGASFLGSVASSPFNFTATGLAAASYSITAVATAAGVSATSPVVNITVKPPAPTVSITNPVSGSVFAAPASLKLGATAGAAKTDPLATAGVSIGAVTNVAFFAGNTQLGSAQASPFKVTGSSLGAGNYSLTAVATAAGLSATSAVVNISIVTPVAISNATPAINAGHFSFDYSVNPGLSYAIETSSNLVNWRPVATNIPSSSPATFTDNSGLSNSLFYEVVLLPNP